jgi:hypothetical protein
LADRESVLFDINDRTFIKVEMRTLPKEENRDMKKILITLLGVLVCAVAIIVHASVYVSLDQALPSAVDVASIAPVFDFDTDGCLPSAGISPNGDQNGGLNPTGSITGGCRYSNFMESSNTVHRYACTTRDGVTYCGHFFALYFLKDQILSGIKSGHRHDWEYAAVWTINGGITHGSYSAHGDLYTDEVANLPFQDGHLKIVYHKDGALTHCMRFAGSDEAAENPYGTFVTPPIISWYEFTGDGWSNLVMRTLLNNYDYGSANLPMRDSSFLNNLNTFRPSNYPEFTEDDALASNPGVNEKWVQFINNASGLCMDITGQNMTNGTNVGLWNCNGGSWQKWYLEGSTGMIHSLKDPRFCLDNNSAYENGANIMIWTCWGGDPQRFINNGDGTFSVAAAPVQVIDAYGTNAGDNVGTWENWHGINQQWTLQP